MNRSLRRRGLGIVIALMGAVFTLQGVGVLTGSQMTGQTLWAVIGPVIALLGAVLALSTFRRRR